MKKSKPKSQSTEQPAVELATPGEVEQFAGTKSEPRGESRPSDDSGPSATEPTAEPEQAPDWKDKFLRAKADFQNLQRRALEEQRTTSRYANADFARGLLEVLDDLERTLQAGDEADDASSVLSGVRLVSDKLRKCLKDHDVDPIEALGQPFDPRLHEALLQEFSEDHPPNTVIREIQKGYKLHDRVLRPSRVTISKAAEDDGGSRPSTED